MGNCGMGSFVKCCANDRQIIKFTVQHLVTMAASLVMNSAQVIRGKTDPVPFLLKCRTCAAFTAQRASIGFGDDAIRKT